MGCMVVHRVRYRLILTSLDYIVIPRDDVGVGVFGDYLRGVELQRVRGGLVRSDAV